MKLRWTNRKTDPSIDWSQIHRVLLVRLRSIGDTVLMTPCLTALKQHRPDVHIAVLLETPIAPLLEGHPHVDEVIVLDRRWNQFRDGLERVRLARRLRAAQFDIAFNMHGGTTATFLCALVGARHRVGYRGYAYSFLLNHRAPDPDVIWGKPTVHSVEQQIGLLKWAGLPVERIPATSLYPGDPAFHRAFHRLSRAGIPRHFALIHPAATADDKRWPPRKFAQVVRYLATQHGLPSVAIAAQHEDYLLHSLKGFAGQSTFTFAGLPLKEVMALCALARIFIGNDSGPAHMAMAMRCPTVVVFGSSDPTVWGPWGETPHAMVTATRDLSGRRLSPTERIAYVQVEDVLDAVDRVLAEAGRPSSTSSSSSPPGVRQSTP